MVAAGMLSSATYRMMALVASWEIPSALLTLCAMYGDGDAARIARPSRGVCLISVLFAVTASFR